MDRQALLKSVPEGEERLLFAKALDQAIFAMKRREPAFTDFMDRAKCARFRERLQGLRELEITLFGGTEDCERQMMGFFTEPLVAEDTAVCFVAEEISPYITAVLEQVSRTAVVAEETEQAEDIPQRQTEARRLTVASMRLDAVASEAFHLARGKTQTLIHAEKAQVNWNIVTSTSHLLKEGDLVSLRGFGRFRVKEIGGRTKKDRIGLEIEKYV